MVNFLHLPKLRPIRFGQRYPLFTRISIETTKTCTRACWFCPSEQRGKKTDTMSDAVYTKIVDELAALNFSGVVQWFYLNEPLLDRNHLQRIAQLRRACPKVTIHLTSNWDTMYKRTDAQQIAHIRALFDAGVNSLNLNDYDARGYARLLPQAASISGAVINDHNWKKLGPRKRVLSCGPLPEKLHTWSGYVADTKDIPSQGGKGKCPRPMRHIVVAYDGSVPICCAVNSTTSTPVGSLHTHSLLDVWNNATMFQLRERLQRGERSGACEGCTATVAYSHVFRRVSGVPQPSVPATALP
jgi:MoaA/NifB/PqqE/SkfB family radical SAM enzyme